jgi:transmembrane sensor
VSLSGKSTRTFPAAPPADDPLEAHRQALLDRFPSREALLREARAQTRRDSARRKRGKAATAIATTAALAALWIADPAWHQEEIRTAAGERATWTLADGSLLRLNTDSRMTVDTRLRSRQFTLHEGEAAFTVAPGWRPFLVHAGPVTVRDIGTAFNVRRFGDSRVRVSVTEGTVEVLHPAASRVLAAPRQLDADAAGLRDAGATADASAVAWQRGVLVFDGVPLADVAAEVSRYRARPVMLADSAAAGLRLSGSYDISRIEGLIDSLPLSLPVTVERQADGGVRIASRR